MAERSADDLPITQFVSYLVEVIAYLFPVLSFYLHLMISKMFRKELKSFISRDRPLPIESPYCTRQS